MNTHTRWCPHTEYQRKCTSTLTTVCITLKKQFFARTTPFTLHTTHTHILYTHNNTTIISTGGVKIERERSSDSVRERERETEYLKTERDRERERREREREGERRELPIANSFPFHLNITLYHHHTYTTHHHHSLLLLLLFRLYCCYSHDDDDV